MGDKSKNGLTRGAVPTRGQAKLELKLVAAPEPLRSILSAPGDSSLGANSSHLVGLTFSPSARSDYFLIRAELGRLISLFAEHTERADKDGPCIGPVLDGNGRDDRAVREANFLIYDIDGAATFDEVDAIIEAAGIEALVWTTHSHKSTASDAGCGAYRRWAECNGHPEAPTDDSFRAFLAANPRTAHYRDVKLLHDGRPKNVRRRGKLVEVYTFQHAPLDKLRVIVPLAEPIVIKGCDGVGIDGYRRIYESVGILLFKSRFDTACKNPSRLFYLASHRPGGEFHVRHFQGVLFSWRPYWTPAVAAAVAEQREQRKVRLRAFEASPPRDLTEIHHWLKSIPSDAPYNEWYSALGAVHFESRGSEAGYVLAREWSEGDPRFDLDEFDAIWFGFSPDCPNPATMGTLIALARKYDPASAPLKRRRRGSGSNLWHNV